MLYARSLTADLQAALERVVLGREEERRRLRRDLHDGLGPALAGHLLRLEALAGRVRSDDELRRDLDSLRSELSGTVLEVRRVVEGLRPPALDDLGLAGALEQEGADLALFGQQSADGGGACLWAAVADRLRQPVVSQVSELAVDGSSLTGKRQTEFGYDTIRAPLPAVVAVADSINTPRYPSLKGIMGAKKKPVPT